MTRFARAEGSKASNVREPEEATPWHVMKQDLEQKKFENVECDSEKFSYKKYLEESTVNSDPLWVEFSDEETSTRKNGSQNLKNNVITDKKGKKRAYKTPTENSESRIIDDLKNTKKIKKEKINKDVNDEVSKNCGKTNKVKKEKSRKLKKVKLNLEGTSEVNQKTIDQQSQVTIKIKKTKKNITEKILSADQSSKGDNKKKEKDSNKQLKKLKKKKSEKIKEYSETNETTYNNGTSKVNVPKENDQKFVQQKKIKVNKNDFRVSELHYKQNFNNYYNRRKPIIEECEIGGQKMTLMYLDGFPVKKEDGDRILKLRKDLTSKGVPRSEIEKAMKLERRRAEKALTREKKKRCFNCRGVGHVLSECPNIGQELIETSATGICYKCGSTEHTHFECKVVRDDAYKFAQCFVCKEQGHISRQCPDNPKGLYPQGGSCNVCGDVTHLKKDCPTYISKQESDKLFADTIDNDNLETIKDSNFTLNKEKVKNEKIVKF